MGNEQKFNHHLAVVFDEILPTLTNAGIKYWVFGGVGIAGSVGKFIRENQDVDVYVLNDSFQKVENLLKQLCETHGGWDGDGWKLSYSVLRGTKRWKLDISISGTERFSVVPIYRTEDGIEFRVIEVQKLSDAALVQELKVVDGYQFFSPPKPIIAQLLRFLAERYISHYNKPKPIDENSKHLIDAKAVFTRDEMEDLIKRFNEKAKVVADRDASGGR